MSRSTNAETRWGTQTVPSDGAPSGDSNASLELQYEESSGVPEKVESTGMLKRFQMNVAFSVYWNLGKFKHEREEFWLLSGLINFSES